MRETAFYTLLLTALASIGCGQENCDNAPVDYDCSSCPVFIENGGAVNLLNGAGLELSDADSESGAFPSLQAAFVELQTDTPADTDSVTLTVNDTVCQKYGFICTPGMVSGRAVLNITGNQSLASYEKVLVQVKFNITAKEPVLMDRLVALKVSDGRYWSDPAIIAVAVIGDNDNPPTISVMPTGLPFEEGNSIGVVVASSVIISDVDDDVFVEARVTILNVQDDGYEWLSTYNLTVYNMSVTDGTTLVVTGNKSSITYSTILESIRYYNNASEPNATTRTIQFTINDGMYDSSDFVNITISPRNDNPPMINVSALPNFTEGGRPLNFFTNTLSLYDADSINSIVYIQSFTAILIGGTLNESLMTKDTTNISRNISRDGIVFSGNHTIDEYQMAAHSIVYVNSGDELSCPFYRTINLTIEDGVHINNVTQVMFFLNPINNKAPEITLQNDNVIFTEGSSLGVVVFPNLTITDADEECSEKVLQFAHVTLHVPYTEDEYISIMFCDELDGSGSGLYQCDPVDMGADNVTMTMDNGTEPFSVTRQLVNDNIRLTITGEAPLEVYQDLLQLIFYNNSADEPKVGDRTVSLLVDDGENSSIVEVNITVTPLADNRPVINPDGDPMMTENMGPVPIIHDITDGDQLDEHQLIYQINISLHNASGNIGNEDILLMNGTISDSGSVSVNCADCQDLDCCVNKVQGVMYNNTADEPLYPYWRVFAVQIKAAGITPYSPLMDYVNISIELVNDNPPIIQVNGSAPADKIFCTNFTEGRGPVLIFDNPRISDGDVGNNFITSVTIAVDDEGNMNNTLYDWFMSNSTTNLTITNTSGLLEISGSADSQEYMKFLSTVHYFNQLEEPYSMYQRRNITVTIREGNQHSVAYIVVKIIPENDPAQFNFTNKTIVFYEVTREPVMLFELNDVIIDPDEDAGNLTFATLTLWPIVHEGDTISINSIKEGSPLDIYCNGTYINISGAANIIVYQNILRTVAFVNKRFDSPSTPRQVIVNTFDGMDDGIAMINIMINTTDDLPVCFFGENIEQSTLGTTLQFVECEGASQCGTNLCPKGVSCFNITDFDSNDTFPEDAVAIVIITNAFDAASMGINKNEEIIFASTVVMEVNSSLFMVQYEISNVSTYTELSQLLRSAIYNNTAAPLVTGLRTINISINVTNRTGPQQCRVTVNVTRTGRLRTVLPSSLLSDPVLNYTEDSGPIQLIPEDLQDDFSFTLDDGLNTGYRVTLTIINASNTGRLLLPDNFTTPGVSISGNNTSQITVEYLPAFSFTAPVGSFIDTFRAVRIIFGDQAPRSCIRESFENCAVLEFVNLDILKAATHVTRLYVAMEGVNDPPVLTRLRNNLTILNDYLPPEINGGFNTSFLVTESEVTDADRAPYSPDFVGLAIIAVTDGMKDSRAGVWQYRNNSSTEWTNITNVGDCYPVFIPPEGFIRFYPTVNPNQSDANVTVTVRAWDGTSRDTSCKNGVDYETSPVSNSTETFTYQLVYLNRAPFTTEIDYNITTDEDIASDSVNVSTIVMALGGVDPEGAELGLAVVFLNSNNDTGYWQYQPNIAMDSWMNIPYNSSADNAFLLLPTDMLRFSPTDNYFGSSYITVLAATEGEPSEGRIVKTSSDNSYTGSYSVLHPSNISVTVISVLDPPVLDCPTTEITYTENAAPVFIFEGLTIDSVETDELESATIKLWTEEEITDTLHYPSTSNFDVIDDEDPHCITINATYNNSINAFQYFLRQISFSIENDTEIEPGVQIRTVSLTMTDSFGTNSSKAVSISVTLVNDHAPSILLPEDNVTFIEDTGQVQLFATPPNITDLDDNPRQRSVIDSAYVLPYDPYNFSDSEWLSFNNGLPYNNITGLFYNGYLELRGTKTIEEYEQAFTRIYYHNNLSEPNDLQRVLEISVFDQEFISDGVLLYIAFMLVNDQPPAIQLGSDDMNNSITFTEGSGPVFIAPQAVITDEDSDSNDSISYSLHVQIINPYDDEVIFRDYPTNRSANFSIAGPTSIEDIEQALSELRYVNKAIQPTGSYRLIRVDVFDTYDEFGRAFMDTAYVRVDFTLTDDLPQFNFNVTAILYQEGDSPIQVAPSLTIVDVDDTEISSAVIKLTADNITLNFSVEIIDIDQDLLNYTNITLSQSYGWLILVGTDRIETYEQILRTLTYEYTIAMGNPVEGKRILQGYVEGIRVNTTSEVDALDICFSSIDNSPIVDLNGVGVMQRGQNYSTEFVEEGDPVAIASDTAFIEDVDSATLQYINITLTNPVDGNEEGIMLMGYYNHSVQYNMEGPLSTFSEVLRNITYINTADEPAPDQRVIIVVASDGSTYSDPVQSIINIHLTDDIPRLYLNGDRMSVNYSITFIENGGPVNLSVAPLVDDSDAVNVTELAITLSPAYGIVTATEQLYMINDYYVYNETTTIDQITDIISSLMYEDDSDEPLPGDRLVCLSVTTDGVRSNTACTEVMLVPEDDSPVKFTMNFSGIVFENETKVNVIQVTAEDDDTVNSVVNITYSIVNITAIPYDQSCSGEFISGSGAMMSDPYPFTIDQTSGWISITDSPLDRETYSTYVIVVEATDGEYSDTSYVTIVVEDVDDNCAIFYPTMYSVTVPQGAEATIDLVDLIACDPDGDTITVELASATSFFGLSGLTLQLLEDERALVEKNQSMYDVTVVINSNILSVADCNEEIALVRVNVQLNNATPRFMVDNYHVSFLENLVTTSLLQVVAMDDDTGSNADISYTIISNMTSLPFAINSSTGIILVTQTLDFEERSNYSFLVSAADQGVFPKSSTVLVEVWVENVNDEPPVFSQSEYTVSVLENVSVPYNLIQVEALDIDGVNITYKLTNLDPILIGLFQIDVITGLISVVDSTLLDHENFETINFTVMANDTLNAAEVYIIVRVIDINEAPVFTMAVYNVMINESFTPNMFPDEKNVTGSGVIEESVREIIQVTAIDPDGDDITYNLYPQPYFAINASTGVITSDFLFDQEAMAGFTIVVQAFDDMNSVGNATVEVVVLDINDNTPTFVPQLYSKTLAEDFLIGNHVLYVTVCDLDETSTIDDISIAQYDVPFNLTTPVMTSNGCYESSLLLTSSLDYETTRMYSLAIEATDTGTPPLTGTGTVSISVLDVNDNPPVIAINIVDSLLEVAPIRSFIGNFTVTDEDSGINADSMIVTSTGVTAINGTILLAQQLDYEDATDFSFTIIAINVASPNFVTTVSEAVMVENVNDVAAVLTAERQEVNFFEGFSTVSLNPGITITDDDNTMLYSATVRFSGISSREPQLFFTPNNNVLPYDCPLEDKFEKFVSCGFNDAELIIDSESSFFNGALLNGATLYLNASSMQYMVYSGRPNDISNGVSVLFWVRKTSMLTPSVQPILTKGNVFLNRDTFSISCLKDNSLQFSFDNGTAQQRIILNYNCSNLEDYWHHMGIMLRPQNNLWTITLHVDDIVVDSQELGVLAADVTGQFLIGTDTDRQNFFNGAIHFAVVSTELADNKNDINCAIGCGVTLHSMINTSLYYKYLYNESTLYVSGMASLETYAQFFNSLYFISTFSQFYSDLYTLSFSVVEVPPTTDEQMPLTFNIVLFIINEGTPVLLLDGDISPNYETSFTEEGPPASLVNVNSLSLTDSDLNPSNYTVFVTLLDPLQGDEERVDINGVFPLLQINRSHPHYLTITGNTNILDIESALRSVIYSNTAEELNGTHRIVEFVVDDNFRGQQLTSTPAMTHITFIPVNDLPEIVLQSFLNYTEGDIIDVVRDISITDNDGAVVTMALITLTVFDVNKEEIDIDTNGTDIVAEYSNNNATIQLTGNGTHYDYQQVLTTLTYLHSSENPTASTRIISIVISDGENSSEPVNVLIFFESVNDAPVLDPNGPLSSLKFITEFVEDVTVAVNILSTNFTLFDSDNSSLAYVTLLLVDAPDSDQEFLRVYTNDGFTDNQTITIDPYYVNFSYVTAFQEALATAQYVNTAEEPTGGIRNVTFIISDGIDRSVSFACVQVITRNDPPQLDLDGNNTESFNYYTVFVDSGGAIPITSNVVIEDNDDNSAITFFTISLRNPVDGGMEMIMFDLQSSLNCSYNTPFYIRCDVAGFNTDQVIDILNSVWYNNTKDEPTLETRQIEFMVSDGFAYSNIASAFINITLVNEYNPQFIMADYSVNIEENQPAGSEINITNFRAFDSDNGRDGDISYFIDSGNEFDHFSINTTTGVLFTNVMLDSENISSYQLLVVATDDGVPPRSGMVNVQINVTNLNDNVPQFADDTIFNLSVSESAAINDIIYSISAIDVDGDVVIFSYESGEDVIGVTMDGRIVVLAGLDADNGTSAPVYSITVTIADDTGRNTTGVFTIDVLDENDNPPSFLFGVYEIFVSEGISIGERIGEEVNAIDNDVTSNLTYMIVNPSTFKVIDGQYLAVVASLDREVQDQYSFTLSVSDGLNVATTSVRVTVTDINDNAPMFDRSSYNFNISENNVVFSEFVTAVDADLGSNSDITYFISEPVGDVVQINSLTGEVTLSNALDFEAMTFIDFTVYARDGGNPPLNSSVLVTIAVGDVNEEIPVFTQAVYTTDVIEGVANITIATVSLSNNDEAFEFSLADDFDTFAIDPTSGEITAIVSLDYESICTYHLIVTATNSEHQNNGSLLQSTVIVEVFVINVHDVPPVFNQSMYAVSVYENQTAGSLVTVVYATDEDSSLQLCNILGSGSGEDQIQDGGVLNSELRYSLDNYTNLFMINSLTGEITTGLRLDREESMRYSVPVTVTDIANATDTTIVNIIVLDLNDNRPRFSNENYSIAVEENTPVGSSVFQVTANDRDMLDNGNLLYALPVEVSAFSISSVTGVISVLEPIDFESGPTEYSFNAIVHDSASQNDTALIIITIVDVNDVIPVISNITSSVTYSEGQVSLRSLSTMVISDEDSFQTIDSAQVRLAVPSTGGAVSDDCRCSDAQNSSTCGPVGCTEFLQLGYDFPGIVTLSQLNDSVILLSLTGTYNISIYANALRNAEYINVIPNPSVEPRRLYITVNDGSFDSNPVMQNIIVEPFNEFIPVLDLNGINMDGNNFITSFTEHGDPIAIVSMDVIILDNDTDASLDVITAAVVEVINPLDGAMEYLSSTQTLSDDIVVQNNVSHNLTLTGEGSFDEYYQILLGLQYVNTMPEPFLTSRQIRFTLNQYQHVSEPVYTTVNIVGVNNHSPMIMLGGDNLQNYQTQFLEGSIGVPITSPSVHIIDMDSGDDIIESLEIAPVLPFVASDRIFVSDMSQLPATITVDSPGPGYLTLNGPASVDDFITAIRLVYYQTTDDEFVVGNPITKILRVTAADSTSTSLLSFSTIILVPINDQQPSFGLDTLQVNVSELIPVGSVIVTLTAVDNDSLLQPTTLYSIVNDPSQLPFCLNATTGELTTTQTLDSDASSRLYVLMVQARDAEYNGIILPGMLTLSIFIEDENDNDPFFVASLYNTSVVESVTNGTIIIILTAIDNDVDEVNRLIEYDIINNTDFIIDTNGNVMTNTLLDRERQDFYEIMVVARHPNNSDSSGTTLFNIYVLDVNDNDHMLNLIPNFDILEEPTTMIMLSTMLSIMDDDLDSILDYATIQILPSSNMLPLGQLFSLHSTPAIALTGNNSQMLQYTGEASIQEYEELLRSIMYRDDAVEPIPVTRLVEYTVASQNVTATSVFNISVVVINDNPPYLTLDRTNSTGPGDLSDIVLEGAYFTAFIEEGDPISITSQFLDIIDIDSGLGYLSYAIVYIKDSRDERLIVNLTDSIQFSTDSNDTWLNLTGPAAIEDFEDILRRIRYVNLADEPTRELKEVLFYVNDGKFDSNLASAYVTIITRNDVPIITLGQDGTVDITLMYLEDQSEPLLPAQYIQINDAENDPITIVTIIINSKLPEETLTISPTTSDFTIFNTANGLILLHTASALEFEVVLRTLEYRNSGTMVPDQLPRMISFTATDSSGLTSEESFALINFESVDNPPMIDLNGNFIPGVNFSTVFTEGGSRIPIVSSQASISDIDSEELHLMVILFKNIPDLSAEDIVIQNTTGVMSVQRYRDNNSLCINITGQRPISDYLSVLTSVMYVNMADEPSPVQREILTQVYSIDTNGNLTVSNEVYSLITIAYINDHSPVFTRNVYNGSVLENSPAGTEVNVTVLATDDDRYGRTNITYRLPPEVIDHFVVNPITGIISTTNITLDREINNSVTFRVLAIDNDIDTRTGTATVTINVLGVNDNPPVFSPLTFTPPLVIPENMSTGVTIESVTASDPDTGTNGLVMYRVYSMPLVFSDVGSGVSSDEPFGVVNDNGVAVLSLIANLDREAVSEYIVTIEATDGVYTDAVNISIIVSDVNDNAPVFTNLPSSLNISEDAPISTVLYQATAEDADLDANIQFSLLTFANIFSINSTTGVITLTDSLDYEQTQEYTLTVQAFDSTPPGMTSQGILIITISDVNEPPQFDPEIYTVEIDENSIVRIALNANDPENDAIFYSFNDLTDLFNINPSTGIVSSVDVLDYESQPQINLTVRAIDGDNFDIAYILITLLDVNDFAPVFDRELYSATVSENAPVNSIIVTVTALDVDSSSNGVVIYDIVQGNSDNLFRIDPNNGSIILMSSLDFETATSYNLTVAAMDLGTPALTGTVIVQVNVTNINDVAPVLTISESLVTYRENSNEVLIAMGLEIVDNDGPLHPLMGAIVILDAGVCRLSSDELQEACQQQDPSCLSYCAERLTFDRSLLSRYGLSELQMISTDHLIALTGSAPESYYQEVMRSFAYINLADEPVAGNRTVSFQVTDNLGNINRVGESNIINVTVNVQLIDEYCPVISSATNRVTFVEGSNSTLVGQNVVFSVTDRDREPHKMLTSLEITLRDRQTEESISVTENSVLLVNSVVSGSDVTIRVQGAATVELYRQVLETLEYHNTEDEPALNQRLIIISPFVSDDIFCAASYSIGINITPINDNPPVLTTDVQTVNYTEQSGALLFAQSAGLSLTDPDHNDIFNIVSAEVVLTDVRDDNSETIGFSAAPPDEANIVQENHRIFINYTASVSAYNSLLSNLTYRDVNPEPAPGMRFITITISDGNHYASTMIIIVILSINDNTPMLQAGSSLVTLTEGTTEFRVGQEAMLVLIDRDGEINSLQITLSNRVEQSEEIRIANSSTISSNGTSIFINRTMSVDAYQGILNNLVYLYPQATEPLAGNRTITISVSDNNYTSTVSVTVHVELINDNIPVVDLNGPLMDGLNHSTSVVFSIMPSRQAIATPFVNITDNDNDAYINRLEIRLNEESDDSLVLNLTDCNLPQGVDQISCQVMTDPQFSCVCGDNLVHSQDPRILEVYLTQKSIVVMQSRDLVSFEAFQYLLSNLVWFRHSPTPPTRSYTSVISVVVFDGQFYSRPANTTITVQLAPSVIVPILREDGATNISVVVEDGTPSIPIAANASIASDGVMLRGMIVTLTNIIHAGEEFLSFTSVESGITLESRSDENLIFSGTATVQSYAMLLQSVSYNYARMSSLIDNAPDLSPRTIVIEIVDFEGRLSPRGQIALIMDDICRVTIYGDTVTITTMEDFEEISICRGLELDLDIRDPFGTGISSLRPLNNIRFVRKLTIDDVAMLTTLEGLENLESYNSLEIINNYRLTTLRHLSSNHPPLGLTVRNVYISSNMHLQDIDGLQHIKNVTGNLELFLNSMLRNLDGLNNIVQVENLVIFNLPLITDLNTANSLWKANTVTIISNTALQRITGFRRLREAYSLSIRDNLLSNIDGFGGVLSVFSVTIKSNPSLCHILSEIPSTAYWEGLGAQEIDVDVDSSCAQRNCLDSPCYNGGHCVTTTDSYTCMCSGTGYYNGNDLQGCLFFNACQPEPCLNGGNCVLAELDLLGYRCECPDYFSGPSCEFENECDSQQPCVNGVCEDQSNGYQCFCSLGYTGTNCSINIDDCDPNPCENGGSCLDGIDGYSCNCSAGFTGDTCTVPL